MWEKALVMAAGGVPPDVVNVSLAVGLPARRSGMLLDLRPFIERDRFEMTHFRPGYELTLGPDWAWDGKIYGIPYGFGLLNIFYNREMFREAGLPEPYKGWTEIGVLTAARRLARDIDQMVTLMFLAVQRQVFTTARGSFWTEETTLIRIPEG